MYKCGDVLNVKVTGIEDYGIFVSIDDDFSGLIHISEISDKFVRNISDYVNLNEEISAVVIECNEQEKKVKLSIKNFDYKHDGSLNPDKEDGFFSLQEKLPFWIDEYKNGEKSIS